MTLTPDAATADAPHATSQSLRIILNGVFKDKRRIFLAMLATFAMAAAVAVLVTPKYVAESRLLVPLSPDYAARAAIGSTSAASPVMLEKDAFLKSEVEILTSASLAKTALNEIGLDRIYPTIAKPGLRASLTAFLAEEFRSAATAMGVKLTRPRSVDLLDVAALAFAKDLTVTPDKIGNIITVSFRNSDPVVAAEAVNDLVSAYLVKRASLFADVQSPIVADQAEVLRVQLDRSARAYADFKAENNIADYTLQRDILLRQQGDIAKDMQLAENDFAQATQRAAVLQHELDQTPNDIVSYGNAPQLVRHGRPNVVDALEIDRARVRQDLEASKARRDTDRAQLTQIDESIKRLEAKSYELDQLDRQRTLTGQNYAAVMKALDARSFEENVSARKSASVRVIEPAAPPVDSGNIRLVILAAGALLSLFAGVVTAILSETLRRGFISPDALERSLGLPVLAAIPDLAGPPDLFGSRAARPQGQRTAR